MVTMACPLSAESCAASFAPLSTWAGEAVGASAITMGLPALPSGADGLGVDASAVGDATVGAPSGRLHAASTSAASRGR